MSLSKIGSVALLWGAALLTSAGWAQAPPQGEHPQTVQYTSTRTNEPTAKGAKEPVETRKVMTSGRYLQREEIKNTPGDPQPAGQFRVEQPADYVMIHNYKTGESITLFPSQKAYRIDREIHGIDPKTEKDVVTKIGPQPKYDLYKAASLIPFEMEKAKKLAGREIDGKQTEGFEWVEKADQFGGTTTWTHTYWLDQATKRPLRMETTIRSTSPMMGGSDFVQSDYVFDAPLDEALFSTEPPAGYRDVAAEPKKAAPAKN